MPHLSYQFFELNSFMAPKINEASGRYDFPHPILGSVITSAKHELLTKFLRINNPIFQDTKSKDAFEFIIDCYKRLHNMGIVKKHGVKFMTFMLEKDAKQ